MLTKRSLPATAPGLGDKVPEAGTGDQVPAGKSMYMAAGSGLLLIDITNPLAPKLLGSFGTQDVACHLYDTAAKENAA